MASLDVLGAAGRPLSCHAELEGPIARAADELLGESPYRYLTYLRSRPPSAEDQAIALLIALARDRRARVHVVHCSSAGALELLSAARDEGVPIGAETCPHYLHFAAERVPDRATEFKCAPPIREEENRERLWDGLSGGLLDMIVSDHSPCTPELKRNSGGDFLSAWGGVASLQLALPAAWTEMRRRGHAVTRLAEWMSAAPARHAGLGNRKGPSRGPDDDSAGSDAASPSTGRACTQNPFTPYMASAVRGGGHHVRGRQSPSARDSTRRPPARLLRGLRRRSDHDGHERSRPGTTHHCALTAHRSRQRARRRRRDGGQREFFAGRRTWGDRCSSRARRVRGPGSGFKAGRTRRRRSGQEGASSGSHARQIRSVVVTQALQRNYPEAASSRPARRRAADRPARGAALVRLLPRCRQDDHTERVPLRRRQGGHDLSMSSNPTAAWPGCARRPGSRGLRSGRLHRELVDIDAIASGCRVSSAATFLGDAQNADAGPGAQHERAGDAAPARTGPYWQSFSWAGGCRDQHELDTGTSRENRGPLNARGLWRGGQRRALRQERG